MAMNSTNQDLLLDADSIDCVVCYEDFSEEHPPVFLDNCRHAFGKQCLEAWMASKNKQRYKCPNCRGPIGWFKDEHGQPQLDLPTETTPTADQQGPIPEDIDAQTHELHAKFLRSVYHASSFHRRLWRHVSRDLAPMYIAANHLITPEIDVQARLMLIELLQGVSYYADAVDRPHYRHLLKQSLEGDQMATLLTRRIMQWVKTMLMLSPLIPREKHVIRGCFNMIPNLQDVLSFEVINCAVADPSPENASILRVLTTLLVDGNAELGEQWHVSAEPSDEYYIATERVKQRLRRLDATEQEAYRQMKVPNATVATLWMPGADDEEEGEEKGGEVEGQTGGCGRFKGIRDAVRSLFRRNDGIREAPRVLTRNSRSRSSRMGLEIRVYGGLTRVHLHRSENFRERRARLLSPTSAELRRAYTSQLAS